jgi:hypothetical protein
MSPLLLERVHCSRDLQGRQAAVGKRARTTAVPSWERSSIQRLLITPLGQVTCRFTQSTAKSAWEKPPSLVCQLVEARIGPIRFTLCFRRAVTTSLAVA